MEDQKKKKGKRRIAREMAVQALYQYDVAHRSLEDLKNLDWWASEKKPFAESKAYFETLLGGFFTHQEEIDQKIREFANKIDFSAMMPIDKAILRMAIFSLLFEREISPTIIINEAIEIAKEYSGKDAHKFINGVLDGVRKSIAENSGYSQT